MKNRTHITLVMAVASMLAAVPPLSAQDGVEDILRRDYELPLRWDNIEGHPEWVSGIEPSFSLLARRHEVVLAPGEGTCVRIPAYEMLRILRGGQGLVPGEVEIALSTGSGLLAFTEPTPDANGISLLVDPERPYPMLAHVTRPAHFTEAIRVSLYSSRHVPLREVGSYRDLIRFGAKNKVRLTTSVEAEALEFWRWNRGDGVTLNLRGPGRYLLETRYRYPPCERKLPQTYRIQVRDGDSNTPVATVDYATSHETAHLVCAEGEAQVVSRLEPGFFELTEDRDYRVTLQTTAPVFVRLLRMEDPAYLIASLNAPDPRPGEVARELRPRRFQQSLWEIPEDGLGRALGDPISFPADQLERAAMRLERDNLRREGGMMAIALLWNGGAPRRDYPNIRERWREYTGFRTYYRDALPEGACLGALKRAYFPARTLQGIGTYREWLVLGTQHLDAGFGRLPLATFGPIQNGGTKSIYRLPERATASIIRIAAERKSERASDFWVRIPGEKARRFRLLPQPELPWRETKPTQGEAALTLIPGDTLKTPASLRRESNNLVPTGYFEFFVPARVRRIELWNAEGSEHLPVAVQYRASDVFELSEDEYDSVVENLGDQDRDRVFPLLVEFLTGEEVARGDGGEPGAREELFNHWEPLRRFVRSRYRQFVDSVAVEGNMDPTASRLAEADRLLAEGEYFLAERLARYLYLYANDDATRRGAFTRLTEIAERHLEEDRIVMNACVAMVVEPGTAHAAALGQLLREQAEPELALMLALALPPGDAMTCDLRLACTFVKGWWEHFRAILRERPVQPEARVWYARKLWRDGNADEARRQLNLAGGIGMEWLAHLEAAHRASARVFGGEAEGLREWARSETSHPGVMHWAPVSHEQVRSFRAGVTVRALEREKYFHAFIASPDEPLELQFPSPRKLRIECRPLHPSGSDEPIEGWVVLEAGGAQRKLPVIANYRSTGLEVVGREFEQPGTLVWDEFGIAGWNTRLRIRPTGCRVIVRILSEEPEARLSHLPPLTYETAAHSFGGRKPAPAPSAEAHRQKKQDDPGFGSVMVLESGQTIVRRPLERPFADPAADRLSAVRRAMSGLAAVPQPLPRQDQRDALRRMTDLLWTYEHGGPPQQRETIALASAYLDANRRFPELGRTHARIVRPTIWEPVLAAEESAGFREVELAGWHPENPDLLSRMRLLPPLGEREQLISGTDSVVAMLTNKEDNTVRVRLAMEAVPWLVPKPLRARVQVGEDAPRDVTLAGEELTKEFAFELPAGQTSLRVEALASEPNHFLKVGIDAEKERELYERKTRRNYFVSTADEPLAVRIDGPAWVRIDRFIDGETRSAHRLVRNAVETLALPPQDPGGESLYRVHVLRLDPAKPFQPPVFVERAVETVGPPLRGQAFQERATLVEYVDEFHLGSQEDGTWSLGLSYNSRRAVEEDSFGGLDPERFWQMDFTHRYYNDYLRTYFRTTFLGRLREQGPETFGIEHSLQHRPFDHPLVYTLGGSAFWQDGDWSLSLLGSISLTQELSPKWSHTPSVSVFLREMSRDDAGRFPERVDQDVFTRFKSDHRRGLRLRDEVAYTPWRDTRLFAGGQIGTNEDFNLFAPDSVTYWVGIDQLLGPVRLGVDFRGYRFFADDDRDAAVWRHQLSVEATGEFWLPNQQRLELGAKTTHFLEDNENAFFLFARWHFGEGRMLRDFRPGEKPFLSSRDRRIPQERNNELRLFHGEDDEERFRGNK